jgi:hypothetical protein
MSRDIGLDPAEPGLPVCRSDLLGLGHSPKSIECAVRRGDLIRVRRGVYTLARPDEPRELLHRGIVVPAWVMAQERELSDRTAAALLACPRAVASHESAALFHGLPLLRTPDAPRLTVPAGTALRTLAGVRLHRAELPKSHLSGKDARFTSVARTTVDLGRWLPFVDAVVVIDAALNRRMTTTDHLIKVARDCATWPRIGRALKALAAADGLAESALETVSRLQMVVTGLPTPTLQAEFIDPISGKVDRGDFYWPEFRTVGEADGLGKYASRSTLTREKLREDRLRSQELTVVRWTFVDTQNPQEFAARIRSAFQRSSRFAPVRPPKALP